MFTRLHSYLYARVVEFDISIEKERRERREEKRIKASKQKLSFRVTLDQALAGFDPIQRPASGQPNSIVVV